MYQNYHQCECVDPVSPPHMLSAVTCHVLPGIAAGGWTVSQAAQPCRATRQLHTAAADVLRAQACRNADRDCGKGCPHKCCMFAVITVLR